MYGGREGCRDINIQYNFNLQMLMFFSVVFVFVYKIYWSRNYVPSIPHVRFAAMWNFILCVYYWYSSFGSSTLGRALWWSSFVQRTPNGKRSLPATDRLNFKCIPLSFEHGLNVSSFASFFPQIVHCLPNGKRLEEMGSVNLVVFDRSVSTFFF